MMSLHAKSYICGYVMFLCKIDEEWSCGCWIMNEFMIICCLCYFETCCWWIDSMRFPICELVMRFVVVVVIIVKVWWIVEFWWNDVLISTFMHPLSMFSCIWHVNIICNEFCVGKDTNWEFLGKGVWNSKFFDWIDERSLERASSEL